MLARALVVICLLVSTACGFFAPGKITQMVPGGNLMTGALECWLVFELSKYPEGADRSDLEVVFTSEAIDGEESFDWEFIAERDRLLESNDKNAATSPDDDPPLGKPIRVKFPIPSKERFRIESGDVVELRADLYWGGEHVASETRTIEHVYSRETASR